MVRMLLFWCTDALLEWGQERLSPQLEHDRPVLV